MAKKLVRVEGCDDTTRIVDEFSAEEIACLERVSSAVNAASTYTCMPRFYVEEAIVLCPHHKPVGDYCSDCPDGDAVGKDGGR